MTGLQVWLHPSSRTIFCRDVTCYVSYHETLFFRPRNNLPAFLSASAETLQATSLRSDSAALRRTATVMRNRRDVADRTHFDSRGSQRADSRLTARTWAADSNVNAANTMI